METYVKQLATLFRNVVLNSVGVERNFFKLLEDKDITKAISLLQDRHEDVDVAIKEYNPQTHKVMDRPNKRRKGEAPYITEKLPRTRQRYINEIELFFLFGAPLKYKKKDGDDAAYDLFLKFIKDNRMDSLHRQLKRLAGSETEAALVFHLYQEDGDIRCKPFIAARSTGYDIRPLFDQYGNLLSFAYGYTVKTGPDKSVQHWDFLTQQLIVEASKDTAGWNVGNRENIAKKICAIYARQSKAWEGVEPRIHREEMMDSQIGDTNNYFADPVAFATADVVNLMTKGDREKIGRLLQYTGKDSQFGYINPPNDSESRAAEKIELARSILFDTFTPDFSYDSIKGMGTLSGEAMENAMILGFIKRAKNMEIYGELMDREVSVIKAILGVMHPEMKAAFDALEVEVEFQSPFTKQNTSLWASIGKLYKDGICSLDTAVTLLAITDAPEEEIAKIKESQQEAAALMAAAKGKTE